MCVVVVDSCVLIVVATGRAPTVCELVCCGAGWGVRRLFLGVWLSDCGAEGMRHVGEMQIMRWCKVCCHYCTSCAAAHARACHRG